MSDKVWLLSYPRSGNSMLSSMALASIPGCGFESVYKEDHDAPRFLGELDKLGIKPPPDPKVTLVKTHHWHEPVPTKIIWLLRDGRDALASYWHLREKNTQYRDPISFWTALSYGDPARGVGARWDYYVLYVDRLLAGRDRLEVRYEVLKAHPEREMERVADYIGLKFDPSGLDRVAFQKVHSVNPKFYRQGLIGGYKYLYRQAVDYLERELGPTLRSVGY